MDKRKLNGGHSTSSKKTIDRRRRISMSDNKSVDAFFDGFKEDLQLFYNSAFKTFLDKHIKHGECYVYFHYLDDEIVYIGKGKGERVFNDNRTKEEHVKLLKEDRIRQVVICNNLDEEISLLIESSLIYSLKPIFNLQNV